MPAASYVRYAPEVEVQQPGEEDDVAAVRETFARMRTFAFEKHRHGVRDAHAKSHGILAGELRVIGDLPDELRQGLFREAATYPVVVRLSTSPGDIVPDGVAALRGTAITAEYHLQVQLATDLETMPVEDASVEWPEQQSPHRTVATPVLPPQDPSSPARRVHADDVLSFNPWHGLVEHQPLGSIQRVRRPVYDDSADDRHHHNAVGRSEPDSIHALPA